MIIYLKILRVSFILLIILTQVSKKGSLMYISKNHPGIGFIIIINIVFTVVDKHLKNQLLYLTSSSIYVLFLKMFIIVY